MINFGIVKPGSVLEIPFDSFAGATGASITMTGLAVTDIEIYKDGSMTQRASDSGYALLDTDGIDLDGTTGIHGFTIDLADNTTAGFYASGSRYYVVVSAITVDSQTVNFVAAVFRIGLTAAILNTTIATLATQTSFTLTAGPAEDLALNGCKIYIHDVASAVQGSFVVVLDYTGATKTVTLVTAPTFTIAATDHVAIFEPTDVERIVADIVAQVATASDLVDEMDSTSTKLQDIDDQSTAAAEGIYALQPFKDNIGATGNDTTHIHLPALTYADDKINNQLIQLYDNSTGILYSLWIEDWVNATKLATITPALPVSPEASIDYFYLTSIRRDVAGSIATGGITTASFAAGAINAVAIASDAITDAKVASDVTIASVTGAVGSVTGAVGSVTGAVGSVTGSTAQTGDSFARIGAAGAGLTAVPWNATWDAEVESEVNDAIDTAIAELGVAAPTATPSIRTGMMLMYMALRNKLVVQTSGTDAIEIYNNAGTKIAAKAITDDGSDYTENEMA